MTPTPWLVDAHAHLDRYEDAEIDGVLSELEEHRILTLAQAMDPDACARTRELARGRPWILPSFGVHPWHAHEWAGRLPELRQQARESLLLGEVGLDHHFVKDTSRYPAQQAVFECFLEVARELDLVVNLHTKGAESEVARLLETHGIRRAIVHWYSGPWRPFEALLAQGACFTVGVGLLKSPRLEKLARRVPMDRLLTETDNPGAWQWLAGTPGPPSLLLQVVTRLASLRGLAETELVPRIQENLVRLLGPELLGPDLLRAPAPPA